MSRKPDLFNLLNQIGCDDTQMVIHNYSESEEETFFNISITDEYSRTVEILLSKDLGVLKCSGEFNYKTLAIINLLNEYINSVSRARFRKDFVINEK